MFETRKTRHTAQGLAAAIVAIGLLVTAFGGAAGAQDWLLVRAAADGDDTHALPFDTFVSYEEPTPSMRVAGGRFTVQNWNRSSGCEIEFDDPDALLIQPDQALNQFANDPWREACDSVWSEVEATKYQHLHLGYIDPMIGWCANSDEELYGQYARLSSNDIWTASCEAIDPLTEPRSSPWAHGKTEVVRIRMYDDDGYQPFRLDRIRVKNVPVRLCMQPVDAGPGYEAAGPPQPGAMAGATCFELDPGYWDLSNHNDNTGAVTITGVVGGPFTFDDIGITDQS